MCLIVHKPAGTPIPFDLIDCAWNDNSDGAGLMYMNADGQPTVYKVLPGAWADPAQHIDRVLAPLLDREVGLHFRWKTHGPIDESNTHPYEIPGALGYVMHNGIMSPDKAYYDLKLDKSMSDTAYYVSRVLKGAPGCDDAEFWQFVAADIGTSNKLLVMDRAGLFARINDRQWSQYKGLHLSNNLSIPEFAHWRQSWKHYDDGYGFGPDYSERGTGTAATHRRGRYGTTATERKIIMLPGPSKADTGKTPPAKLSRRERKVLSACLKAGHWGPFSALCTRDDDK